MKQAQAAPTKQVPTSPTTNIKYVGARPKSDIDNKCRSKLCHLVKDMGCFYEIGAEKLYLVYLAKDEDLDLFCEHANDVHCPFIFWTLRDDPNITYESFYMDFGPFNLGVTHQFITKIKEWFDTSPEKHVVVVLDDNDTEKKLNATLLVAMAAMVLLGLSDEEVLQRLSFLMMYQGPIGEPCKQLLFREKRKFSDVSGNSSLMNLTLEDCIKGFFAAFQHKFYDYHNFDPVAYLYYETVTSGDLNWVIPNKILAFAGPSIKPNSVYNKHPPKFYFEYFKEHNVTTVIRLNEPEYASSEFTDIGIEHFDLIFPDGYPPTSPIALKFIRIVDEAKGAVAVHCHAGIGRTGTLIAAYLMKRYKFTPQMAIAWTRICRPGSVIGEQQDWLYTKFDNMSNPTVVSGSPKTPKTPKTKQSNASNEKSKSASNYAEAEETYGQARALLITKAKRKQCDTSTSTSKSRTRATTST